jgi:hypothetical protein
MSSPSTKLAVRDGLLKKLFSEPPSMMNGEDANLYTALRAEIDELMQPRNVLEQMMVKDIADHYWQQNRYRRNMGGLINIYRRQALQQILTETIGLKAEAARKIADSYFDFDRSKFGLDDPSANRIGVYRIKVPFDISKLLAKHNLDESSIDQLALQMSTDAIRKLDDLAFRHELRREQILGDVERRRKERPNRPTPSDNNVAVAQVRPLPNTQQMIAPPPPRNHDGDRKANRREPS